MKKQQPTKFEKAASIQPRGFFSELWSFLKTNKKWWLLPIVILFLIFALLILLSSTGLAPFIYTIW
ncbi:MAG TPA: DUF5989 family protein [Verrucomicrobiae bacterium]|nr:DUF5989 family protein [Verrucomicrobiae bacterium]